MIYQASQQIRADLYASSPDECDHLLLDDLPTGARIVSRELIDGRMHLVAEYEVTS